MKIMFWVFGVLVIFLLLFIFDVMLFGITKSCCPEIMEHGHIISKHQNKKNKNYIIKYMNEQGTERYARVNKELWDIAENDCYVEVQTKITPMFRMAITPGTVKSLQTNKGLE